MFKNANFMKLDDVNKINTHDLNSTLHQILNYVIETTNADAGTIYLKDNNHLKFNIFQNNSLTKKKLIDLDTKLNNIDLLIKEDSDIIAVESFIQSKIITIDDIYKEKTYNFKEAKKFDEIFSYKTKSILTAPLINYTTNESIGVIQLINKKENGKNVVFTQKDKEYISLACYFITFTIVNTQKNLKVIQKYKDTTLELENMANKDPLTNLYNRRYFNDVIENMIHLSNREDSKITILMIDIDDFKMINDTYGHSVGDNVINTLANVFNKTIRNSDISIRYGGEEFVIILPYTNIKNGKIIAEKLRKTTENTKIVLDDNTTIQFTISIGLSEINKDEDDISIALDKADKALYSAKQSGKNKTSV